MKLFSSFQATFPGCRFVFSVSDGFFFLLIFLSFHAKNTPQQTSMFLHLHGNRGRPSHDTEELLWLAGSCESFGLSFSKHLLPNRSLPLLGEGRSLPPPRWHHHGTGTSSLRHHHAACRSTGGSLHPATVCPLRLASRPVWRDDAIGPDSWCYDLPPSVSLFVSGANAGSTNEVAGNSLNQPITMLDRSKSSSRIWAAPMKDLWSIRP